MKDVELSKIVAVNRNVGGEQRGFASEEAAEGDAEGFSTVEGLDVHPEVEAMDRNGGIKALSCGLLESLKTNNFDADFLGLSTKRV